MHDDGQIIIYLVEGQIKFVIGQSRSAVVESAGEARRLVGFGCLSNRRNRRGGHGLACGSGYSSENSQALSQKHEENSSPA